MEDILFGEMPVRVVAGGPLRCPARLSLGDLLVISGPYQSADEHERHLLETSGAGTWVYNASDELRFFLGAGELASAWLRIPGCVAPDSADLGSWLRAGRVEGQPEVAPGSSFDLPPGSVRWCEGSGSVLVCLTDEGYSGDAVVRSRLRIAQDLDVLMADGRYVGWCLAHPARHLSNSWTENPASLDDPELGAWLARYFALTGDVAFEAIEDGDGTPLDRLKELRADVHSEEGNRPGRRILRDVLDELIDWHTPARG